MDSAIQLSFEQLGPDVKNVRAESESVDAAPISTYKFSKLISIHFLKECVESI